MMADKTELTCIELEYIDSALLFNRVEDEPWAVFLDSGCLDGCRSAIKNANYDVLAIRPYTTLITENNETRVCDYSSEYYNKESQHRDKKESVFTDDPIEIVKRYLPEKQIKTKSSGSPYIPGALGYFSYDLARYFEELPSVADNDEVLPEMAIGLYSVVVVVDHCACKTRIVMQNSQDDAQALAKYWRRLINSVRNDSEPISIEQRLLCQPMQENLSAQQYQKAFQRIRDYTIAGDCYQVNLAKQFSAKVKGDTWQSYIFLRQLSPAPYGAYLNLPFARVLSNSPESFIQCRERKVVCSPIKGTRPRDHSDKQKDKQIAQALLESEKDRAENLMIVDLMRNDLSKCCELSSVKVPKLFAVHAFANVHHLISTVVGKLKKSLHSLDVLKSCFPGGSITGAPKRRAMEIIEELEPNRRGLYCGSIAYIGIDGSLETNIAIRSIVVKDDIARFSAGGGLVIDSQLDEEYQELIDKADRMVAALYQRENKDNKTIV